ncbi:HlyD family secretion protein [Chitinophaga costaii]|uniref:HlyD family secretion protein n=1 Tax=Chitinophaga costaii TaxID=1335309 RepID=A0A1C4DDX6_9BACT|nr:efflux RND transporter periplasmic adaptor subunit [Chitinophaga costaii]PUZ24581.1 efflux RND transporter periplasmic adaptor subunit [Chitinophaga costaii]SCC29483.1 HlyD family secretion protein [Chitinophaga costaii]
MKKYRRVIIIVSIIVALLLVWVFFFRKKAQPVVLDTEQPTTGYIATSVTATGTVQPVDTVAVGTQVSGTAAKIYADFNSTVKQGQILAELDKSLFQAQVDQYRANLANAQSNVVYQQSNYARQEQLYKLGAISRADYDNATYAINAAKASVESVRAQLQSAVKNLSFATIYSPIDGVVLSRNISVGQTVAASFNTPTLFIIAKDISKMQVQANVDEADIGEVQKDQRVTFTVDAYLEDVFTGGVQEIRLKPTVSSNVVTYTTIINATNNDQKLKPGMTANVTIYTKEVENALLISVKALKFTPDESLAKEYTILPADTAAKRHHGDIAHKMRPPALSDTAGTKHKDTTILQASETAYVWVLHDKTLTEKRIRTGLNDDTRVQVLKGLSTGDVVVDGIQIPQAKGAAVPAAKSPFMPARRGGGGRPR